MEPKGERSRAGRPTSVEAAALTERLRRTAFDTFLENGYDGTSMEAVAQAAGITKTTLYARYPDKRALFVAVSSWALTRQERNERVLEPLPDDLAGALLVIARAILARSVDPDIVRMSRMAIAVMPKFPEFAASSQAVTWSPRIQVIIDLLKAQERAGTVALDDVELAAEQFFAMVGAMPAWLSAYGIYRTPDVEERHLQHAVRLFLDGILVRPGQPSGTSHPSNTLQPDVEGRATAGPASDGTNDAQVDVDGRPIADPLPASPTDNAHIDVEGAATAGGLPSASAAVQVSPIHRPAPADGTSYPAAAGARRRFGTSGLEVSAVALGTADFGAPGGPDTRVATGLIRRYLDGGGDFLVMTPGASEEICGRAVRGHRGDVVLATTVGADPTDGTVRDRGTGNGRRWIRAACEDSLRRLDTDYLDLLQVAVDDPTTPLAETVDALDELVRAGRVLYVGISGVPAYRLMKALAVADARHRARFTVLAAPYGLGDRSAEREHFPLLAEEGLGFLSTPPAARADTPDLHTAAAVLGCPPAQLALAWQWTGPVTSVLATAAALDDHLTAARLALPTEVVATLDRTTPSGGGGFVPGASDHPE